MRDRSEELLRRWDAVAEALVEARASRASGAPPRWARWAQRALWAAVAVAAATLWTVEVGEAGARRRLLELVVSGSPERTP